MKNLLVFLLMIFSVLVILNPGWGVIDIIPDNFPLIGNLDEAGAVALLLACLRYYGIDLTTFLRGRKSEEGNEERVKLVK